MPALCLLPFAWCIRTPSHGGKQSAALQGDEGVTPKPERRDLPESVEIVCNNVVGKFWTASQRVVSIIGCTARGAGVPWFFLAA